MTNNTCTALDTQITLIPLDTHIYIDNLIEKLGRFYHNPVEITLQLIGAIFWATNTFDMTDENFEEDAHQFYTEMPFLTDLLFHVEDVATSEFNTVDYDVISEMACFLIEESIENMYSYLYTLTLKYRLPNTELVIYEVTRNKIIIGIHYDINSHAA